MRLAVVLNPLAHGGACERLYAEIKASSQGRELGLNSATHYPHDAEPNRDRRTEALVLWLLAQAEKGLTGIVAGGGDGTVNLVVEAMMRLQAREPQLAERLSLGALGLGSSNDFHKPYALATRRLIASVPVRMDFAGAVASDIGSLESGQKQGYFINNASVGLAASANADFNRSGLWRNALKRTSVDAAILLSATRAFATYENIDIDLRVGSGSAASRNTSMTNLTIAKNVHFSGNFRYDVPIQADSGTFGVFLCEGMGRMRTLKTLLALGQGKFAGRAGTSWTYADEVAVEAKQVFPVETDGELWTTSRAVLRVVPKALRVCP